MSYGAIISITRLTVKSTHPPKYAEIRPMIEPISVDIITDMKPISQPISSPSPHGAIRSR
jgi:hypothetical protein